MAATVVLQVDPQHPDPQLIAAAAQAIAAGSLVAFPTETVYGLGANALDPAAVDRIFAAKRRPYSDPLIVHVASLDHIADIARDVPPQALELGAAFWPGPLTLVLRRGARTAPNVSGGRDTVAVRIPSHPVAQALLACRRPAHRRAQRQPLYPAQPDDGAARARRPGRPRRDHPRRRPDDHRPGVDGRRHDAGPAPPPAPRRHAGGGPACPCARPGRAHGCPRAGRPRTCRRARHAAQALLAARPRPAAGRRCSCSLGRGCADRRPPAQPRPACRRTGDR